MAANKNQMPVLYSGNCSREVLEADGPDKIHACYIPKTRFKLLGDWIYIHRWDSYLSPGDLLLLGGMYCFKPFLFAFVVLVLNDYKFFG
jgi:hypothetical protein